jgi:hypothetical protein
MLIGAPNGLSEFVMVRVLRQLGSNLIRASTRGVYMPTRLLSQVTVVQPPSFDYLRHVGLHREIMHRLHDWHDCLRVYAIVIWQESRTRGEE